MSNRPRSFNNRTRTSTSHHPKHKITHKDILKWVAIILVILMLFWLFMAEDIRA